MNLWKGNERHVHGYRGLKFDESLAKEQELGSGKSLNDQLLSNTLNLRTRNVILSLWRRVFRASSSHHHLNLLLSNGRIPLLAIRHSSPSKPNRG